MSQRSSPVPPPSDLILERLTRLHPKIIDLSLDRVARLLDALGQPQRRLPPVVHVAGTNGKGSVIAYLRAMLEAAGARVHVYTSPHLVRFNERIRLAGRLVDETALAALLEECERVNGSEPITFFEITTAAAFLAFAREPADVVLLETGLGGRLDATNLVERPLLTVLTPISFDHRQHLGDTLAQIAGEKAGIMKPGVPAVVAPQPPEAAAVFAARAAALGLPLYRHAEEWQVSAAADLRFRAGDREWLLPRPALLGQHQIINAGTALAASQFLGDFGLDATAMARGLREVEWPARLQRLAQGPLPARLPAGWELWLDGGHNGAAGEALADFVAGWRRDGADLHLVFGMLDTKEPAEFLAPLAPFTASLRAVTIPGSHAALPAESAAAVAREVGMTASAAASVGAAVEAIVAGARRDRPARILICGSLYLAGSVLAENT
jgi:dihydrofolate synthase/folylpolyglutamate synthase